MGKLVADGKVKPVKELYNQYERLLMEALALKTTVKMRLMTERPLNAETPIESLLSWITDNEVFFKRNQG